MFQHDKAHTGRSPLLGSQYSYLRWRFSAPHQGAASNTYSSPVIGPDGTIFVGCSDGNLYALNSDGSEKWAYNTGAAITSSAAVRLDGTVIVGSAKNVYAINSDGTKDWVFAAGGTVWAPAIADGGTVYIGSDDDNIYAINSDGSKAWTYPTSGAVESCPAIDQKGVIYVAANDGYIYAVDSSGSKEWSYYVGNVKGASPSVTSSSTIYIGEIALNSDGTLKWGSAASSDISAWSCPAVETSNTIVISNAGTVYGFSPSGSLEGTFGSSESDLLVHSAAVGSDGTMYFAPLDLFAVNYEGSQMWEYKWSWDSSVQVATAAQTDIAIGPNGVIYVSGADGLYAVGGNTPAGRSRSPANRTVTIQ
jgi:outer membrane protein assembly factor BamB